MSYKEKPILKLYKYENNTFSLQAIIDDFIECSFERNLYQAGSFTISINYNIPNAQLFQRGLFVQFGNDPYDFGEIISISDAISSDGKGSQLRTITGYDSRYILKRRVIKNMNSNGLWVMTGKGETVLRNLIADQCGAGAEAKRQLPIINSIPDPANAIGKEYSVSEQFSNLYEVCKTIATQSEIGWRLKFDNSSLTLTLECYEGENRAQTVQFSTSFDSLADGQFTDSSDSYTNAIYVGGKGQNDDRDIYEGEDGAPEGLDRYEAWDNQSNMTTEDEYEAEALSMLTQYGQTVTVSGNGLAKSPYIYKEEYDVGDIITLAFSGKSAAVQILSVTEHWAFGQYSINFSFGKPQNNIQDQLQLILRKIQTASEKTESTDSVRWYTIPTDTEMPKADVTYRTIGFVGNVGNGATFKLYLDNEKTGAKTYHIYFKQLAGAGKLTLTTGKEGASNLVLNAGTYVAIVYVDENGNITSQGMTATNTVEAGNNQPATSSGVAGAISDEASARNTAITDAINALDVASVGGSGKYISAISETDGKISATAGDISGTVTAGDSAPVSGGAVADILSNLPTDAVLHYSFDEVPDYPDGTAVYKHIKDFTSTSDWNISTNNATYSVDNGVAVWTLTNNSQLDIFKSIPNIAGKLFKIKFRGSISGREFRVIGRVGSTYVSLATYITNGKWQEVALLLRSDINETFILSVTNNETNSKLEIEAIYIGDGSYSTPIIDNANGKWNSVSQSGVAVQGVSGKGLKCYTNNQVNLGNFKFANDYTVSLWINPENTTVNQQGVILIKGTSFNLRNGTSNTSKPTLIVYPNGVSTSFTILDDLLPTKWSHLVLVKNGTKLTIFLDGIKKTEFTLTSANLTQTDSDITLNVNSNTRPQSYDDLLIFDRALTEKEVLALYYNKANTPKYYNINNYNLKQIKDITVQSTDFADFQSRMAGLATRSLQLIEPTEDER